MFKLINESIGNEVRLLVAAFVLGVVLMMLYDVIRLIRFMIKHRFLAVAVEDSIFWMIASLGIFALLFLLNEGNIRFYALGAVGIGMSVYYYRIGKKWPKILKKLFKKKTKTID